MRAGRRALELDPTNAAAAFNIALVHLASKDEQSARAAYASAIFVAEALSPNERDAALQAARSDLGDLRKTHHSLASTIAELEVQLGPNRLIKD